MPSIRTSGQQHDLSPPGDTAPQAIDLRMMPEGFVDLTAKSTRR